MALRLYRDEDLQYRELSERARGEELFLYRGFDTGVLSTTSMALSLFIDPLTVSESELH